MLREATEGDLLQVLKLYLHLHESAIPQDTLQLRRVWQEILRDKNHHLIVQEIDGKLVSSCVCLIVPNLTRGARPYALVENVVTHKDYRGRGYATACLDYARELARQQGCYKLMLLTGAKDEKTLGFYRKAGYNSEEKTGFVQRLDN